MIPVSPIIAICFLIAYAFAGMAMGALTGLLASLMLKLKIRAIGIIKDGLLGSLGFLVGFVGAALVPWPRNTISYYVDHTLVTSTMNSYQHPDRVGFVAAILLPLLREVYRFKHSKIRFTV